MIHILHFNGLVFDLSRVNRHMRYALLYSSWAHLHERIDDEGCGPVMAAIREPILCYS